MVRVARGLAAAGTCLMLAGCLGAGSGGGAEVSRFGAGPDSVRALQGEASPLINDLRARRSALPEGGSFHEVARAVLDGYSRSAESDLLSARLRAEAASKNWLPRIGPNISLTSLSDVVGQLIIEQVLFDNGRKKAERAFAAADVEVAAVTLSQDVNNRVLSGLTLYLEAEQARERRALEAQTLEDMAHFEWIMSERVKGGVSDVSDLTVLRTRLAEIREVMAAQAEAERTALAELAAMAARPMDGVRGLSEVRVAEGPVALSVLRAEAEAERDVAEAMVARAGFLPGVVAGGTVGGGSTDFAVRLRTEQLWGLGTGAELRALEAEKEAATRRSAQAAEDSDRVVRRLDARLDALTRQAIEAGALRDQARANLDLFQRQYDGGQRQVMDVVGVYETFAERQARALALKYELARARLELAAHLGVLADGSRM
ncbi:TolC family protein [Roseovarius sp. MBR-6]|uniref:TolC family protein n=1 Tax=Roseovarius sp. MBR-6 TaxID=3156459 RepID=UPI00339B3D95